MLIRELTLRGLLSFGPETAPLPLLPLNVLIGPNGSGKSNLVEAIGLLRSTVTKLTGPMRASPGGVSEWIWKGTENHLAKLAAIIEVLPGIAAPVRHSLTFVGSSSHVVLTEELIEDYKGEPEPQFHYRLQKGRSVLSSPGGPRTIKIEDLEPDESILSQRKDPEQYPVLARLGELYGRVRVYRDWSFGRSSVFRMPQPADMPSDPLEEDFSNLGLFLNHLRSTPKAKNTIIEYLRDLYEGLDDFDVRVKGGTVEVFLTEGEFIIPAGRLSDGTLRYLCLLAILCDPDPPPLVCIEEPELGLHPDLLPKIADLLVATSQRMQLVVTTHSDILVDALTEQPESVVVVEKHDGKTQMKRLEATDELKQWLGKYRLGQLWTRGEIGGTRW